jgi:hypothetical protein
MAAAPRSLALSVFSAPLKAPMGVRAAEAMTIVSEGMQVLLRRVESVAAREMLQRRRL